MTSKFQLDWDFIMFLRKMQQNFRVFAEKSAKKANWKKVDFFIVLFLHFINALKLSARGDLGRGLSLTEALRDA